VTPEQIEAEWSPEQLNLMLARLAERRERESERQSEILKAIFGGK